MADRVLVMSNQPTRVLEDITVDLPRPRLRSDLLADEQSQQAKRHALDVLTGARV
jgi:ABC-type nitrate/sulfonate/bicarbonate transport system ATPase subunit